MREGNMFRQAFQYRHRHPIATTGMARYLVLQDLIFKSSPWSRKYAADDIKIVGGALKMIKRQGVRSCWSWVSDTCKWAEGVGKVTRFVE